MPISRLIEIDINTGQSGKKLEDLAKKLRDIDSYLKGLGNSGGANSDPFSGVSSGAPKAKKSLEDYQGAVENNTRALLRFSGTVDQNERALLAHDTRVRQLGKALDQGRISAQEYAQATLNSANASQQAGQALINHAGALSNTERLLAQAGVAGKYSERIALKYDSAIRSLNQALARGQIGQKEYNEAMRRTQAEMKSAVSEAQKMDNAFRGSFGGVGQTFGQLGLQMQDVAVQAQMGTNAAIILAQQGPQIASIFGPTGAVVGAFLAVGAVIGGVFIPALFGAQESIEDLLDGVSLMDEVFDDASENASNLSDDLIDLREKSQELAQIKLAQAFVEASKLIKNASSAIKNSVEDATAQGFLSLGEVDDIRVTAKYISDLGDNINRTDFDSLNAGYSEFGPKLKSVNKDLESLSKAFGIKDRDTLVSLATTLGSINQSASVEELEKYRTKIADVALAVRGSNEASLDQKGRMLDVTSQTIALINQLIRANDVVDNFATKQDDMNNALTPDQVKEQAEAAKALTDSYQKLADFSNKSTASQEDLDSAFVNAKRILDQGGMSIQQYIVLLERLNSITIKESKSNKDANSELKEQLRLRIQIAKESGNIGKAIKLEGELAKVGATQSTQALVDQRTELKLRNHDLEEGNKRFEALNKVYQDVQKTANKTSISQEEFNSAQDKAALLLDGTTAGLRLYEQVLENLGKTQIKVTAEQKEEINDFIKSQAGGIITAVDLSEAQELLRQKLESMGVAGLTAKKAMDALTAAFIKNRKESYRPDVSETSYDGLLSNIVGSAGGSLVSVNAAITAIENNIDAGLLPVTQEVINAFDKLKKTSDEITIDIFKSLASGAKTGDFSAFGDKIGRELGDSIGEGFGNVFANVFSTVLSNSASELEKFGSAAGAAIGALIPGGGAQSAGIGALIGQTVGSLFTTTKKKIADGFEIDVVSDTIASAFDTRVIKKSNLFGSKTREYKDAVSSATISALNNSFGLASQEIKAAASVLGVDFDGFTSTVKLKNGDASDALAEAANMAADAAFAALDDYKRIGEQSLDTFLRLAEDARLIQQALNISGVSGTPRANIESGLVSGLTKQYRDEFDILMSERIAIAQRDVELISSIGGEYNRVAAIQSGIQGELKALFDRAGELDPLIAEASTRLVDATTEAAALFNNAMLEAVQNIQGISLDAAGAELVRLSQSYRDNYFTAEENIEKAISDASAGLAKFADLGINTSTTSEQIIDLINGLNEAFQNMSFDTVEASEQAAQSYSEQLVSLLSAADSLATYNDLLDQQDQLLGRSTDTLEATIESLRNTLNPDRELSNALAALNIDESGIPLFLETIANAQLDHVVDELDRLGISFDDFDGIVNVLKGTIETTSESITDQIDNSSRLNSLQAQLYRLQDNDVAAIQIERQEQLNNAQTEAERTLLNQVFAQEDLNKANEEAAALNAKLAAEQSKLNSLQAQLYRLQDNDVAAIQIERQEQLNNAQTEAERTLLNQIFAQEDLNKANEEAARIAAEAARRREEIERERYDLETQLLEIQGDTLALRERELAQLDPSNRALQELVWTLGDAAKAAEELKRANDSLIKSFQSSISSSVSKQAENKSKVTNEALVDALTVSLDRNQQEFLEKYNAVVAERQQEIKDSPMSEWSSIRSNYEVELFEIRDKYERLAAQITANYAEWQSEITSLEKEILSERESLQDRYNKLALSEEELRQLELDSVHSSNRALLERIHLLEMEASFDPLSSAFGLLERSVNAEKEKIKKAYEEREKLIDDQATAYEEANRKASDILSIVENALRSARVESSFLNQAGISSASAMIASFASGADFTSDDLSAAIRLIGKGDFSGSFQTLEDALIASAKINRDLAAIGANSTAEQSETERLIQAVEESREDASDGVESQLEALDRLVEDAKAQVDAINGVDNSIVSVVDAIELLNKVFEDSSSVDKAYYDDQIEKLSLVNSSVNSLAENLGLFNLTPETGGDAIPVYRAPQIVVNNESFSGVISILNAIKQAINDDSFNTNKKLSKIKTNTDYLQKWDLDGIPEERI